MKTTKLYIGKIPVIIWGAKSDKAYIYVHGKMSDKESAESFAQIAENKGYQTISFDLPEHGERESENSPTYILYGGKDNLQSLRVIENFAKSNPVALTISEQSEHSFMGNGDNEIIKSWIYNNL